MTAFHRSNRWQKFSREMRKLITPQLPLPCVECGEPVFAFQPWDVSHIKAYALDPFQPLTPAAVGPGHRGCNRRAGSVLGRAKQTEKKNHDNRLPGW